MIDAAVILLWLDGRLPWPALAVILVRDAGLLLAYPAVRGRGYDFEVNFVGKAATWVLYAALVGLIASDEGTTWPLVLFWSGVGLALVAAVLYVDKARREVRSVKAVVMAGGEGTRLRPLTSNQPKPMVPIVGKPCMEHIVELLRRHGFDDIVVTLAFMPQAIRGYFGDGEAQGVQIRYSVEETPAGTAGSVKLAEEALDEPFVVISGDALCDIDLTELVAFHREREALVTIALKSVDNPLEFGIVVTDEDGRIERFLEKPSWSQVFTDTINTGIYVVQPEVLREIPDDEPYDWSKQLFPRLLEKGRPLYGWIAPGYWKDIGNLDQYREANFDALDERVSLEIPGVRLRGNVWVGEGVGLDDVESVEGPAFIGNYCRLAPGRLDRGLQRPLGERRRPRARARLPLDRGRLDLDRARRRRRGRDRRAHVRHPRARARSTRARRSATRRRSGRRPSSIPASGSIRSRRSSPAPRSTGT